MNKILPSLIVLFSTLATGNLLWAGTVSRDPSLLMPDEWAEFRFERMTVVKGNPDLAAADKKLHADIQAQKALVDAAMIKADPKIAPIMEKLAGLLVNGWGAPPSGAAAMSVAEWNELRAARAAALQADPGLAAANKQLMEEKRAFESKVDAAMLKENPDAALFLKSWPAGQ